MPDNITGWLGRLVQRPRNERLKGLLAEYPPYRIPFPGPGYPGPGHRLSLPEAEANLAYLLENKPARLEIAASLLRAFGLDLGAGLAAAHPRPFLDGIWRWSIEEWPAIYEPALDMTLELWLNSSRDGPEIVYSMLTDIAIVLAEMVLVRRPDYRWALDLDPDNQEIATWRRPVVTRPADAVVPTIAFDFEFATWNSYSRCTKPAYAALNDLGRGTLDAISGAAEAVWRGG